MDRSMIRTVIFDLDDTLYNFDDANKEAARELREKASDLLGVSEEAFEGAYSEAFMGVCRRMGFDEAVGSGHCRTLRMQYALETLSKPLFPNVTILAKTYWDGVLDRMQPEPGIRKLLETLKKQGIRVGCGTNMTATVQYQKIERLQLGEYFDFMVTSMETLKDKPAPCFFDLVIKKAACPKQACLFVGDDPVRDVAGALENGLSAVWYCPERKFSRAQREATVREFNERFSKERLTVVTSHEQLVDFFEALR